MNDGLESSHSFLLDAVESLQMLTKARYTVEEGHERVCDML